MHPADEHIHFLWYTLYIIGEKPIGDATIDKPGARPLRLQHSQKSAARGCKPRPRRVILALVLGDMPSWGPHDVWYTRLVTGGNRRLAGGMDSRNRDESSIHPSGRARLMPAPNSTAYRRNQISNTRLATVRCPEYERIMPTASNTARRCARRGR